MSLGIVALFAAIGGAVWLLIRLAGGERGGAREMTILKIVVWLGLAAALFAVKLWPLAFMVLIAAGGVMAIELWKDRVIEADEASTAPPALRERAQMSFGEAVQVLGLDDEAGPEEIRLAHKRLISQLHPDKGGTDYLASKINEARDLMLARAPSHPELDEPGADEGE